MDRQETFSNRIKRVMGENFDPSISRGTYRGRVYNHICKNLNDNFIDGQVLKYCNIKGDLFNNKIKYHQYAAHLNSSQVMCISFFKKFFESPEGENILLDILKTNGVPIEDNNQIANAIFEYEPDFNERTNFDFYLILSGGQHISFEIKYTETEFGGISSESCENDKYKDKWEKIYFNKVAECPFLDCNMRDFYSNYQINRNIVYAKNNDVALFLTPRANNSSGIAEGQKYIDSLNKKFHNLKNIYWEDIYKVLMEQLEDHDLIEYYKKFGDKYIEIL